MVPEGCYFADRLNDKGAETEFRMRQDQRMATASSPLLLAGAAGDDAVIRQQVEIEGARAPAPGALSAGERFYAVQDAQ